MCGVCDIIKAILGEEQNSERNAVKNPGARREFDMLLDIQEIIAKGKVQAMRDLLKSITSSRSPKHFYFYRNMTAGIMRNSQKERVELQTDLQIFLLR